MQNTPTPRVDGELEDKTKGDGALKHVRSSNNLKVTLTDPEDFKLTKYCAMQCVLTHSTVSF